MIRIDGNHVAQNIKETLKKKTSELISQGKRAPHLTAILVGDDGASQTYVAAKAKDCAYIGFGSEIIRLPETTTEETLLSHIKAINESENTDGLIVQLPLPKHISEQRITDAISVHKDVDGFTPGNFGLVCRGEGGYIPATPYGIIKLLEAYNIETRGKHCVVIGRSNIVGRPMSILLSQPGPQGDATVTICHRHTADLTMWCKQADIIVIAVGKPGMLKASMLKAGAVVIDVGITRVSTLANTKGYELKGDADFDDISTICSAATPVPGGVGPMTRVGLMLNTFDAYTKRFTATK
jgi:methylenetetrahydrofolate dehydrogenase (NADP+)/methenyltetrahydrofolate cyclohydrolase